MAFSIIQRKLFASRIPFIPWPHFFLLSSAWKNRKLRSWNLPTFGPNYNSADCIAHSSQDFLWAASEKRLRLIHIFHALFTLYAQILNAMNPPTVLHICVPDPCSGLPKSGLHSPQSAVRSPWLVRPQFAVLLLFFVSFGSFAFIAKEIKIMNIPKANSNGEKKIAKCQQATQHNCRYSSF